MPEPLPTHRIALEPRSGIWLMFYETLITSSLRKQPDGSYEQQLLRIFTNFYTAETKALFLKADRHINSDIIIRDDNQRNVMLRQL